MTRVGSGRTPWRASGRGPRRTSGRSGLLAGGLVIAWVVGGGAVLGGAAGLALVGLGLGLALAMALPLLGPLEAVAVERILPGEPVRAGASVDVSLVVRACGPWPWFALIVEDVEPAMRGERSEGRLFVLPRRTARLTYRLLRVARGIHHFGQVRICATDPFGLVKHWRLVDLPAELEVWPAPVPAEQVSALLPAALRRAAAGEAGESRGVRPYYPGDPARRVHWPATAKSGRLMVRELEKAGSAPLRVVVDLPPGLAERPERVERFERALSQAAAVVDWGARHHSPIALKVPTGDLPPGRGPVQHRRLMRLLAECRLTDLSDAGSHEGLTLGPPGAGRALLIRLTGEV